ncbi:TonB-dependent receptor plug domain-containing protein [Pararobbsia alpina]|nr:TonB-dependent receptor [Pararobbsia alpina]
MKYSSITRAAWLACAGLAVRAHAQVSADTTTGIVPLEPVVVTATRSVQPLDDTLPASTVFDAQDIADSGASDLAGLLALAPGVQITRNGGPGSSAAMFMRGADTTQSLVIIDGMRVDNVGLGYAQLSQLTLDQVDRVEVVSGNVSALYGSSAIGGVVQVFTRDGGNHPAQVSFSAGYGSYHTQTQSFDVNGALDKSGDTTFDLSLSRYKTDGFSALDPNLAYRYPDGSYSVNPGPNGYLNTSESFSLKHRFGADWDAGIRFYNSTGDVSFDQAYGLPTDNHLEQSQVRLATVFVDGRLTDQWTTHLTLGQSTDHETNTLNGAFDSRFDTRTQQLTWQNEYQLAEHHRLMFGYEYMGEQLDSDELSAPERHVNSVFAGYDGTLGRNQFQANVRHDQYSDFGGANSYYLGYGYRITTALKVIASLSDAFRAPSFDDLYYPGYGDAALQPERSHSAELALQYTSDTLGVIRGNLFQTRYSNLIEAVAGPDYLYYAANVGQAKVQGFELSWRGQLGGTDIRMSGTLQNPVDTSNDEDLARRARRFATVSASRSIAGWRIGGDWIVSGARTDTDGTTLGGYGVLGVFGRYDMTRHWYVSVRLENLLDKRYELASGYNTPGRGAYVTLGYQPQ